MRRSVIVFLAGLACIYAVGQTNPSAPPQKTTTASGASRAQGTNATKAPVKKTTETKDKNTEVPKAPLKKSLILVGDFRAVNQDHTPSACMDKARDIDVDACANLVAANGDIVGTVNSLRLTDDKISLVYTPGPNAADPVSIQLGKKYADTSFPLVQAKTPAKEEELVAVEQSINGDYCLPDASCTCTTTLLAPAAGTAAKGCPVATVGDWKTASIDAYILNAEGLVRSATLKSLSPEAADVSFSAPASFKPASLVLKTTLGSYSFAYSPTRPIQQDNLNYSADDLDTICDLKTNKDGKQAPDCDQTPLTNVALKPLSTGAEVGVVALQDKLLVTRVRAPLGSEPSAMFVTNTCVNRDFTSATQPCEKKTVVVRRATKPGSNNNLLRVDMSVMDQITMDRNYGRRMSKRYVAITLDVKNPTAKKLQFKKSALYFDVDYVEAQERGDGFFQKVALPASLGLYQPSIYKPPFVAKTRDSEKMPREARYGIEQNVKQAPLNYLSALGAFDYTTEVVDKELKGVELFGSLLTTISTGGVIATANSAFRDGAAIFSGTFLPGLRSIILNTPEINRKRTNLVAQTLQEVIEVPAGNTASTIVLLPREGILDFTDSEVPVMIKRVVDVHLEPEVVTDLNETPIQKNTCKVGYTREQMREALGEPTGLTTNADGTSTFTFTKGGVSEASFDAKGFLTSCKTRSATDQLNVSTTMVEANQMLSDLGLSKQAITLTDGSTILTDIAGVQTVYHFDIKGNRLPDYTTLFDAILGEKGSSKDTFDQFLQDKATPLSAQRATAIKDDAKNANNKGLNTDIRYNSPDIQDGWLLVRFKAAGDEKNVTGKSLVDTITFQGTKPSSVK